MPSFEDLRRDYSGTPLVEEGAGDDPFALFGRWWDEVVAAEIDLANGMVLATADAGGQPSARVVLLKGWGPSGFVFYTNDDSRKGIELAVNPQAALLFWWQPLHRQVRTEGRVARITDGESDAYFASRPRASNLSAIASAQSKVVADRAALEQAAREVADTFAGRELVRPPNWGGHRLTPEAFEFWQGREDRLHDRLRFQRTSGGPWRRDRLFP